MDNRRARYNHTDEHNANRNQNQPKQRRGSQTGHHRGHNRGARPNTQNRDALNLTSLSGILNVFDDQPQPPPHHGSQGGDNWKSKRSRSNSNTEFPGNRERPNNAEHSRDNRNRWRPNGPRKLGFKRLEELLEKEPEELIFELLNSRSGLTELVHEQKLAPDFLILIVRLFSKMSECAFSSNTANFLQVTSTPVFLLQLKSFLLLVPHNSSEDKRRNSYFWKNPNDFFTHLNKYLEMIISLSPAMAIEVLPDLLKATTIAIPHLTKFLLEETMTLFENIQEKFMICQEEMTAKYKKKEKVIDNSESEPPDNFRDISLCPLPIEITNREQAFVRRNVIEGPYRDINHYLDVQFRLLREDFVKPLREGICDYMEGQRKKLQNIKIYQNVKFISPHMVNGICGVLIQMEIKDNKMFRKRLENSRRFMFGSLMCFTADNFKTVIFGKIIERKLELLQKGMLVVEFQPGDFKIAYDVKYLMVESGVYFEPYYHVLRALQHLDDSNFPMREYIINVSHETQFPVYTVSQFRGDHVPDADVRKMLNDTQLQAYKNAMNQNFSIIQGPPGTGKTYLGLLIAKALLHKHTEWHRGHYPMLVVCFTNHALDQFLEGLLPVTEDIVRIGGQSKNKNLEQYNIRNARRGNKHNRNAHQVFHEARNKVQHLHNALKKFYEALDKANQYLGVVNVLDVLDKDPELLDTWFGSVREKEFKEWLLGGQTRAERTQAAAVAMMTQDANAENEQDDDSDGEVPLEAFEDENERNQLDLDDNIFSNAININSSNTYLISIDGLQKEIKSLRERKGVLQASPENNHIDIIKIDNEIANLENTLEYIERRMVEGKNMTEFVRPRFINFNQPNNMHPDQRWHIYFYWLNMYRLGVKDQIVEWEAQYQEAYRAYEELREIEDIDVMRGKLVVGMTTTGAARLRGSLRALKSPIVIVEEAAEIMEAHVVTALTEHCKHLILIGDHQQLRPNTADYTMEKKYYLGISLFERMIRNKIHCNVLSVQHRMRPAIARLIAPNIYPHLQNHESVNFFHPVRGVNTSLFFINHKHAETECSDQSKSNVHEVKFLLRLAKYFLLNGYQPEDITILAAYSGQMFEMFKERRRFELLKDVRISVLDNYQGEECKIILLSLVRNNNEGKIGFLSIENRVCVALSRAREGLYIMGNMDMLCGQSMLWQKIRNVLEDQNGLGDSLVLRCQIHNNRMTHVMNENDFYKVAEGGCDLVCGQALACGHVCKSQCHTVNREHNEYKCKEKCTKVLCERGHICPKFCFQDCSDCVVPVPRQLDCGHIMTYPCHQTEFQCTYPVSAELPCNHKVDNKPCYVDVEKFTCPYPCDARLDLCGHVCIQKCHIRNDPDHITYQCHKPCAMYRDGCSLKVETHRCPKLCFDVCPPCGIVVNKQRSCGHVFPVACRVDVETVECEKPCRKKLQCGHKCKSKCMEQCGNCMAKVEKTVATCGHKVQVECYKTPISKDCKKDCPLFLTCGHKCKNKCKDNCTTKCMELVKSSYNARCGHLPKIPCYMNKFEFIVENGTDELSRYCREPCYANLECKHNCAGSCGECFQGRVHKTCAEDCGVPLVCGHECASPCRDACPPCKKKCLYKCSHSKCDKQCGQICTPCAEPCPRRCSHIQCRAKCGETCTVPPCTEPCRRMLKCRHPCIGFCGEPCPPLCMICNRDELLEVFFGTEEEDARYVLLEECNHVVESEGMEMWLAKDESEINVKRCPKCKTPLSLTRRYYEDIKRSIEEVQRVKEKFVGSYAENKDLREELLERMEAISNAQLARYSTVYKTVFNRINDMLKPILNGRKQQWSKNLAQVLSSKIQILENICKLFKDTSSKNPFILTAYHEEISLIYVNVLVERLMKEEYRMTGQEVSDYEVELKRLRRILQMAALARTYPRVKTKSLYVTVREELYAYKKYNVNTDYVVKGNLEKLAKEMGGSLCVTDEEMKAIVKAIGVRHGAWYKCPNGHPYAIGECGGAMQVSQCPDCGAAIGGRSHSLVSGNAHFNVDGSNYAAWSEAANMNNFIIDDD